MRRSAFRPGEAEGRLIYELGNGQWNIPRLRELVEDILPRNNFFGGFEVSHEFESIGRRVMVLNARTLSGPEGRAQRILLGIHDITETVEAQAEVRRSEVRYRRLFEAAQDGVLLVEPSSQRILDANPFMTELLGRTREELRGKTPCELGVFETPEVCQKLFGQLRGAPELQPAKARIEIKGEILAVMGNEAGLTQCFSNLLGNAVKFVKPGEKPEIVIWAERARGTCLGADLGRG